MECSEYDWTKKTRKDRGSGEVVVSDGDMNQSEPFANLESNYYTGSMYFFLCVAHCITLSLKITLMDESSFYCW